MNSGFAAIMTIAAIAARVMICQAQSNVYSLGLSSSSFIPAPHRPDEVMLGNYNFEAAARSSRVEWYVSTNALAKQPRWDGVSSESPLSIEKASALAPKHVRAPFPAVPSWPS